MTTDHIELSCAECGSKAFTLPNDPPQPDDVVTCAGCGRTARYADIQAQAAAKGRTLVNDLVRNAFGVTPKWTKG
jgi:hypothetical protein